MMTPRVTIYVLIALGFAGLIGAHEVAVLDPDADDTLAPFLLATAGTLAFVVAGLMGFRMLRGR
jgi:hypothetical protein